MKVLLIAFDLFSTIGGGQTVYCRLIETNPHIDFYYFIRLESPNTQRPVNANFIPFKENYIFEDYFDRNIPEWIYPRFIEANNIAAALAEKHFDVIDIPDYEQYGVLLRPALRYHKVSFGKIVLSMHGSVSTSIWYSWPLENKINDLVYRISLQEQIQYSLVDVRYGISKDYIEEWQKNGKFKPYFFSPLRFISIPKPVVAPISEDKPSINFIGRKERCKGADVFIDLLWWIPRSNFKDASIVGPDTQNLDGTYAEKYLKEMAAKRLPDIKILPSLNKDALGSLFASKSITVIPSRRDTLNLIALESLLSGCPTAIGSNAGVCRFLKETFPNVPFINIDMKNIYHSIKSINSVLNNYDVYRQQVVQALLAAEPIVEGSSLEEIYLSQATFDYERRNELNEVYSRLIFTQDICYKSRKEVFKARIKKFIKNRVPFILRSKIKKESSARKIKLNWQAFKAFVKKELVTKVSRENLYVVNQINKLPSMVNVYRQIYNMPEVSIKEINTKTQQCWEWANTLKIDRVRLYQEIARLENFRGNELVAATYQIRIMRWLGYDSFDTSDSVGYILEVNGYKQEAATVRAMYSQPENQFLACSNLLNQALKSNQNIRFNYDEDFAFVDDRRTQSNYQVSIIVSLYNAAKKLPRFISTLSNQTLIQSNAVEVILIDSGSPSDEYAAFKQVVAGMDIPIVYARSAKRETIQSAWNRGISLSRSPYMTFLGVDEAILPNCLEILVKELDADPELDWIVGNGLVTNVDKDGIWVSDIMLYNRTDYKQYINYLESCYLNYVGGLYRRSIHERFGYYDPTFTAAGDTEFKNRVLPFIKTKCIPITLGIYLNYPEERTTQHPRAEIEDIRALYLHRTLAGVNYAFSKNPCEAEKAFYEALRYRKSYCQHWSTDIEYAYNLGLFLKDKLPESPALKYFKGVTNLLQAYRQLDWIKNLSPGLPFLKLLDVAQTAAKIEQEHASYHNFGNPKVEPMYKMFNDNRHEQHSNIWSTEG